MEEDLNFHFGAAEFSGPVCHAGKDVHLAGVYVSVELRRKI